VDVVREPIVRRRGRRGALRDMVQALVHGEEEGEDLLPAERLAPVVVTLKSM
jgi:hypothetical protein